MAEPTQPADTPSPNRPIMIVLSYLWILALVPLLVEKRDAEVQWHAKHGLVLIAAEIIFWIAYSIVTNIITAITFGGMSLRSPDARVHAADPGSAHRGDD